MHINVMDQYELEMKYGFDSIDKDQKKKRIDDDLEDLKREMRGEKRKNTSSYNTGSSSNNSSSNSSKKQSSNNYQENNSKKKKYRTPWEILGVAEGSSHKDVKKAYIKLQQKYHPDINPSAEAEEIIKEVNIAYDTLKNKFK
jgi:DnaJ-domain-containing protein 1